MIGGVGLLSTKQGKDDRPGHTVRNDDRDLTAMMRMMMMMVVEEINPSAGQQN